MSKSSEKYLEWKEHYEAQRDQQQIELGERLDRLYQEKKAEYEHYYSEAEYEHYYSEKATQRRASITNALNKVFMDFHPLQFLRDE
jgi:hypothetical protein